MTAIAADRSFARATGNLPDIHATAIASGLDPAGLSSPGPPHGTHARTAQRAGKARIQGQPSQAPILPSSHWAKDLQKFIMTGTPSGPDRGA